MAVKVGYLQKGKQEKLEIKYVPIVTSLTRRDRVRNTEVGEQLEVEPLTKMTKSSVDVEITKEQTR